MSSINPGGGFPSGGNTINPGIPGADTADEWSKYPAVQNVDFGGYTITNAIIEDISQTLVDETLSGTTTLASGHTFSGNIVATNNVQVDQGLVVNGITMLSGDTEVENLLASGDANISGNVNVDGSTTLNNDLHVNGNIYLSTDLDMSGAIHMAGAVNTDSDVNAQGNIDICGSIVSAGTITATDITGSGTITGDAISSGGAVTATGTITGGTLVSNDTITATGGITGSSITASGFGTITTEGDVTCAELDASTQVTTPQVTSDTNLTLTSTNGFVDITSARLRGTLAESGGGDSRMYTNQRSIKWLAVNPPQTTDVNGFEIVAPNGTSSAFCFLGQADGNNTSSMGLACKNTFSSTIVSLAPSAVSGIEKWSFTGKHQGQYTGDLSNDHIGMVVESTGKVCGIYEKDNLVYGINESDPNYSNATPIVRLCSTQKSKSVVGVVRAITDQPDTLNGSLIVQWSEDGYEAGDKRCQINAIGEGLIWVVNTNGTLQNGDLLQSSSVPGYAEKQNDDIVHSYTIGKVTIPCDFIQEQVAKKIILKDDDGENVLDSQGRLIWVNGTEMKNKYKMRYLPSGRKACLVSCIYYCG